MLRSRWGRYVGFMWSADRIDVLRDPSGAQPCYEARLAGVRLIFSDIADICASLPWPQQIDWYVVIAHLWSQGMPTRRTGLVKVGEVLPGERLRIVEGSMTRQRLWEPLDLIDGDEMRTDIELAAAFRSTMTSCIGAWVADAERIVLSLSGGLDSAIILSAARHAAPATRMICVNRFPSARAGDERTFARLVAHHHDVELLELPLVPEHVRLEELFDAPPMCIPSIEPFAWIETQRDLATLGANRCARMFMTGRGGDHLLGHDPLALTLADLGRSEGFGSALLRRALSISLQTRESFWPLLWTAFKHGLMRKRHSPSFEAALAPALLSRDMAPLHIENHLLHPWLERTDRAPAGKAQQIFDLCRAQGLHQHIAPGDASEVIHPMLSQPVVESCLRMPTWQLTRDGRERGLARTAFERSLPPEITTRTSKGDLSEHYARLLCLNESFVRESLMDGILMRERMLDRDGLDQTIKSVTRLHGPEAPAVLRTLAIEAWVRHWVR